MLFTELKIRKELIEALKINEYINLTPIQEATINKALSNCDILAQAPTGTGKTLAFGVPIVEKIDEKIHTAQAIIICPTRELAIQVCLEIKKLLKFLPEINAVTLYGGDSIDKQIRELKKCPQIIVGTPGRLIDHLKRKTLQLDCINTVVLDEADEMLEMGFREEIDEILKSVTKKHQTLLFSATIPYEIKRICKLYQNDAEYISIKGSNEELPKIEQYYIELLDKNKIDCLCRIIDVYNFHQALVFCRTKKSVEQLANELNQRGYLVQSLHGDLKQNTREFVLNQFKKGLSHVLIATDIAARGIDVEGIDVVLNYDIPDDVEYYIHRIGRTGRAGRSGKAYSFVNRKEVSKLKSFEEKTNTKITRINPPTYEEAQSNKVKALLSKLLSEKDDAEVYKNYIYDFCLKSDVNVEIDDIASLLLKKIILGNSSNNDQGEDLSVLSKSKKDKKIQGFTRVFINLGKKDGLTNSDLKGLAKTHRHVCLDQIINIDILSTYSFFEVPNDKVIFVIEELNKLTYKNRDIVAEIAGSRKYDKGNQNNKSKEVKKDKNVLKLKKETKNKRKPKEKVKHKKDRIIDIKW